MTPLPVIFCRWLLSRRARDMGIISDTGAFSIDGLAYAIFMRDKCVLLAGLSLLRHHWVLFVVDSRYVKHI